MKILFKSFLALILVFLICWTVILGLLQTKKGQKWALHRVREYVEAVTDLKFKVEGIRFSFPLNIELHDLEIYQKKHDPLAKIKYLRIACATPHLLNGRLIFSEFTASGIDIFRLPSSNEPLSIAPLPIYLKFSNIDFQDIRIHQDLLQSFALQKELESIVTSSSYNLNGMISNNPFRKSITAHLQIKSKNSNPDIPSLTMGIDALNEQLSLSIHLTHLLVEKVHLDLAGIALYASAPIQDWKKGEIEGHFKLTSNQILLKSSFKLASRNIEFPNIKIKNHSLLIVGKGFVQLDPNPKGMLSLSGKYQNIPGRFSTEFEITDFKRLTLSNLAMKGLNAHAEGNLSCLIPDFLWQGNIEAEIADLEKIAQFSHYPLKGEGKLTAQLDSPNQKQQIDALFMGKNIQWDNWSINLLEMNVAYQESNISGAWKGQTIRWSEGSIERGEGAFANLKSHEFKFNEMNTSALSIQELSGNTSLHHDKSPFHIEVKNDELQMSADGNWNIHNGFTWIEMQSLNGKLGTYPLVLKEPFTFKMSQGQKELSEVRLQLGDGEFQGDLTQDKQFVRMNIQTNELPSELFQLINPHLPLTGKATLQGSIEGDIARPTGHFQVNLHQVQVVEKLFVQKPLINGNVFFDLDERGLHVQSDLHGIGSTPLIVTGSLPLIFSFDPFKFDIDSKLPFQLNVDAEGELDPYLHLFINDTTTLAGKAKIALSLSGKLESPTIRGKIDLTEGSYESLNTGALFHDIQAELTGDGNKLTLTRFSAKDNKNGSVTATGLLMLENNFPFEIRIQPSNISLLNSDYASISASGTLDWKGNSQKSKLQGKLAVEQAIIRLEEALPKQIKTVDFKMIDEDESSPQKPDKKSPVEIDISLVAKENVLIKGNHLKSEWKGNLLASGTLDNILLHGDLRVVSGEYDFNGKAFTLSQGTIHFSGAPDKKTSLYIVASKEIERIRADIIVKGAANKPEVSFRSNPPLSQREVLSYILFNRGISNITPEQGDQLSQSFITLNEQTSTGDDFLTRLRKNIGVDRLDFTTNPANENRAFGVQVGKYITENVIVSVNQNVSSLSPVIAIEASFLKNLKIQAEAGVMEDAPIRMSFKWKKDY